MTHFIDGNQIKLLRNGAEYFPALEAAIDSAKHEVHMQTYIYEPDATGVRIGNALIRAAQRGVKVNVLLDGFGCKNMPNSFILALEAAGVQLMFYRRKISPWTLKRNRLRRLHRKVVVVDGTIGFVGGINVIDDHNAPDQIPPRIDFAVRLEGAILKPIVASVHKLWRRMAWKILQPAHIGVDKFSPKVQANTAEHVIKAAYVLRDNVLHRHDIEEAYLTAIDHAQTEILIANAYFVPGRRFRKALLAAANRGVQVKLLLQGRKEYFLMFATYAFYRIFLTHGIHIYEYRKSFMHAKVAVIDQEWATVGSSNIDPLSLLLALEANVVVQDTNFAHTLSTEIISLIENGAQRVTAEDWARESKVKRFFSWIAYGIVRFFMGVIGYSNE